MVYGQVDRVDRWTDGQGGHVGRVEMWTGGQGEHVGRATVFNFLRTNQRTSINFRLEPS